MPNGYGQLVVAGPGVGAVDGPFWTGVAAVGGFAEVGEREFAGAVGGDCGRGGGGVVDLVGLVVDVYVEATVEGAELLAFVGLRAGVVLADAVGDAEVVAVDGDAEGDRQRQAGLVDVAFDVLGAGVDDAVAAA